MLRPSLAALVVALGTLTTACADPIAPSQGTDLDPGAPTLARRTARITVDGVIAEREWSGAASLPFKANVGSGLVDAVLLAHRDNRNLFLAVRIQRPTVAGEHRWLAFEFDNDDDGSVFEANDDGLFVGGPDFLTGIGDEHREVDGQGSFTESDVLSGGTSDGAAAMGGDGSTMTWELSHPLASGDVYDFAITAARPTIGLYFDVRIPLGTSNLFNAGDHTLTSVASFGGWCRLQVLPTVAFLGCPTGHVAAVRITYGGNAAIVSPLTFVDSDDAHQLTLSLYDYQGTAIPLNAATCIWGSTNEAVATVSQAGALTTVSPGTATILASCRGGTQALLTQGAVDVVVTAP